MVTIKTILAVEHVSKSYKSGLVLDNISFSLIEGEVVGLIGRNGAGKTTLMKAILGLVFPDQGTITYLGRSDYKGNREMMNSLGYLIDCKPYEELTAYENLFIQWSYSGMTTDDNMHKRIRELLEFVELDGNKKRVKEFSFGMKQRLGLALALINNPKLLILDEPFVGLDPMGIRSFKQYIRQLTSQKKVTVLVSSHQLSEIEELCERYLFIENKRLTDYRDEPNKRTVICYDKINKLIMDDILNRYGDALLAITEEKLVVDNNKTDLSPFLKFILNHDLRIKEITTEQSSVNDLFAEEGKDRYAAASTH